MQADSRGSIIVGFALIAVLPDRSQSQVPRDTSSQAEILVPTALAKRWGELFANILEQFRADGRSPIGILQGDFSTREIAILVHPEDEKSGVRSTISPSDLEKGDLKAIAGRIYDRWKQTK